jgi:hypothetical protein
MSAIAEMPSTKVERKHTYHATASILKAKLEKPLEEEVAPQARLKLFGGGDDSHYHFRYADPFQLEGILFYRSGYTQVAGHRSSKPAHGFVTLTTSVVEGLNILDVVTADRVVARIATEHPADGAVPSINFLGTRFENLRIGGHKVDIVTDLDIIGPKPKNDVSYFDKKASMMGKISKQFEKISKAEGLSDWARENYLPRREPGKNPNEAQCSVVSSVNGYPKLNGGNGYPKAFGHVIDLPHFGKIFLGELTINRKEGDALKKEFDSYTFSLTMLRLELGCPVEGGVGVAMTDPNGTGGKGTGGG